MEAVRVDKWLWAARFFKSRTLATAACDAGLVRINGERAKPSRSVRPGDEIRAEVHDRDRILQVTGLADKRGSAANAATLYLDLTPPEPEPDPASVLRERGLGRPTKRDRRRISRIFGEDES
jgi:ribosome-associated heat shock protein Hsp15